MPAPIPPPDSFGPPPIPVPSAVDWIAVACFLLCLVAVVAAGWVTRKEDSR